MHNGGSSSSSQLRQCVSCSNFFQKQGYPHHLKSCQKKASRHQPLPDVDGEVEESDQRVRVDVRPATGPLTFTCNKCRQPFNDSQAYTAHAQACVVRPYAGGEAAVRESEEDENEDGECGRGGDADSGIEEAKSGWPEEQAADAGPFIQEGSGVNMKYSMHHVRMSEARKKKLTPAMRHELWTAHFGLSNGLGREAGQDLIDKHNDDVRELELDRALHHAISYRNVLEKIKKGARYPDVKLYKYENEFTIQVPAGMNGADASTVTFKFANPLDVLAAMLLEEHLHENNPDNIQWDPKHVVVQGAVPEERVYDADIFSGNWARDSKALLKQGQDLLAVAIYSDATNVTGSGSQSAHPIFIQVGNFTEEVRAKDGSFRPVAFFPQLLPLDAVREMESFKDFKDKLFHTCMGVLLQSLKDVQQNGFELTVLGTRRVLVPQIAFFTQDSIEVLTYTAILCSYTTIFFSIYCNILHGILQ